MGRRPVYHNQGQQHIEQLLKHGAQKSVTGSLLRTLIEQHNLELGLGILIFKAPYRQFRYLSTETWVKNTWEFTSRYDITINDSVPNLLLRCNEDSFLMACLADHGFSGKDLARLNICRLYLQVATVSDIASGDGTYMLPFILDCRKDKHQQTSYAWPQAERPSAPTHNLWQQALRATFGQASTGYGHILQQPLGNWYSDSDSYWFYSQSEQRLYRRTTTAWSSYGTSSARPSRHQSRRHFYPKPSVLELPADAVHTIVHAIARSSAVVSTGIRQSINDSTGLTPTSSTPPPPGTLAERLAGSRRSRRWATRKIKMRDDGANVAQAIRDGTARAVSDGSYLISTGNGAAGYVPCGC
eukprot:scaffold69152_cov82-Attheya_sp.AAC.1